MSRVSVIIPTYNRPKQLKRSIQSVLKQTYNDFDIIIVDDASTEDISAVVKEFSDSRLRYHRLKKNKGAAGARNEGTRLSDSEYIAFQDSDDEWLPDKLEKQMNYLAKNQSYDLAYGKIRVISKNDDYIFPTREIEGDLEGNIYKYLLKRNTIGTPTMLIKRECFELIGGFDENLRCLEDWEFSIRFSQRYNIGFVDEVLINSYVSEDGVSRNIGAYYESRCKMIAEYRDDIISLGIFDEIVMDMFRRAEKTGVLPMVQKMLMRYLG